MNLLQHPTRFMRYLYAILLALFFSAFIYLEHFDLTCKALNTLLALGAYLLLFTLPLRSLALGGFFIGLLWFYWIGFSFQYYNSTYMVPIVSVGFGVIYALFFALIGFGKKPWQRALIILVLSFLEPFDFNWMQMELPFVESYFGIAKWQFLLILISFVVGLTCKDEKRLFVLVFLLGAINYSAPHKALAPLKIKLVAMDVPQELKWQPYMLPRMNRSNFDAIDMAIKEQYDLVVLPESAFALFLNRRPDLIEQLEEKSKQIAIVTGALYDENGNNYNVTYFFKDGHHMIAKKMTLVPFGEYIPLPAFIREYINQAFFDGASDYISATAPTTFIINDIPFRNAVCYEATCEELYVGEPKYMIAISNNAWFMPSIEPTLQKLLMRYYALRHHTVIYHAANAAGTGIVE